MSPASPSRRSAAPNWRRTLSNSKSQQPASVSRVFAQPEQGSRLSSAVDHLPALPVDDCSSTSSIMSRKRERVFNTATENEENVKRTRTGSAIPVVVTSPSDEDIHSSIEVVRGAAENQASVVPSESPTDLTVPTAHTLEQTVPSPATELPKSQSAQKSLNSRSSWFGSLSRATGRLQSMKTADTEHGSSTRGSTPAPRALQPDPHPVDTSNTHSIPFPTQPSPPSSTPHSSSSSSPPTGEVASAAKPLVDSPSISSVDEEVPQPRLDAVSLPSEPAPVVLQSQSDSAMGRKPSIASLNPSTSRFMLRIPLLGRPKIPLQQAVASTEESKQENVVKESESSRIEPALPDTGSVSPPTPAAPEPHSTGVVNIDAQPTTAEGQTTLMSPEASGEPSSESVVTAEDDKTPQPSIQVTTTSSWWDYVGWNHGVQSPQEEPARPDTPKAEEHPESPSATSSQVPLSPSPSQDRAATVPAPVSPITQSSPQRKDAEKLPENRSGQDKKPSSLLSAETAKSHGSAWYSPWTWYAMSPSMEVGPPSAQAVESTGDSTPTEVAKTESELVKERALAREEQTAAATSEPFPVDAVPTSTPIPNPIESSITTSRSGWVSFFMSRALLTKSVTEDGRERDENGMEVMNIDEEENGYGSSSTAIAIPTGKQVAQQQIHPSPSSKSGLPPSRREHKKSLGALSVTVEPRKGDAIKRAAARTPSPAPSKASSVSTMASPRAPPPHNLVLPTWEETFLSPPRSNIPPKPQSRKSKLSKTFSLVSEALFNKDEEAEWKRKGKERERERDARFIQFGKELPKALDVVGGQLDPYLMNGGCRVVVIGIAGWSPGPVTRTLAGGFPSSSTKFVDMTCQALEQFEQEHGFRFKKITKIPLDGDGTIERKISRVHDHLLGNDDWMENLHAADVIFVASHSQGCIIATHLIDRLIRDGHILTSRSVDVLTKTAATLAPGGASISTTQAQKICFLSLCGIHLGPLRYLGTSSLLQPYIQYFENAAARELFEFQNTETRLSKNYVKALRNVMDNGTKMVYIASLNDQVVPIYSGLFTAASHPRILRALYIDADAYHSSDFLSNLLVLLIRIMNSGLSDGGLLIHLSEATAGTLSGVGHSSAYEELSTFSLAVKYFFLTTDGDTGAQDLVVEPFNAINEQNDYEIPWSLRDMIADERVAYFFAREFAHLRDAFDDWQPKTSILRDVKRKLQPIQRLTSFTPSTSKL